jgi:O-antigen ligase
MTALPASALFSVCLLLYLALPGAWWAALAVLVAGLWAARWPRQIVLRGMMVASLILPLSNFVAWALTGFSQSFAPVAVNESVMLFVTLALPVFITNEYDTLRGTAWAGVAALAGLKAMYITGGVGLLIGVIVWALLQIENGRDPLRIQSVLPGIAVVALVALLLQVTVLPAALGPRAEIWRVGWDMFADSPLTGQGAGAFAVHWRAARPDWPAYTHAHNLPLHIVAETGLMGLGAVSVLAGVMVRRMWEQRADPWTQSALASLAAFGGVGLADNPLSVGPVVAALGVLVLLACPPNQC